MPRGSIPKVFIDFCHEAKEAITTSTIDNNTQGETDIQIDIKLDGHNITNSNVMASFIKKMKLKLSQHVIKNVNILHKEIEEKKGENVDVNESGIDVSMDDSDVSFQNESEACLENESEEQETHVECSEGESEESEESKCTESQIESQDRETQCPYSQDLFL